jgi:hypothetical protein
LAAASTACSNRSHAPGSISICSGFTRFGFLGGFAMVTLDLNQQPSNAIELHVWRGKAIQAYATIEFNLSMLFSGLLQTPDDYGGIVFFRLTNTNSRNSIFETLLKKRYGDRYLHFWHGIPNTPNKRGLFTLIRKLDQRRNEIVHWHTVNHIHLGDDGEQTSYLDMAPPNAWAFKTEQPNLGVGELQEFCVMADFVARSIGSFFAFVSGAIPADAPAAKTWNDTFQQPCIYPPPKDHPLSPNPEEPENPPQSSPG